MADFVQGGCLSVVRHAKHRNPAERKHRSCAPSRGAAEIVPYHITSRTAASMSTAPLIRPRNTAAPKRCSSL